MMTHRPSPRARRGLLLVASVLAGVLLPGCAGAPEDPPPAPPPPVAARPDPAAGLLPGARAQEEVRAVLAELARADSDEDLEGVMALYADGIEWVDPDGRRVVGRDQVRQEYADVFGLYDLQVEFQADAVELDAANRVARVIGRSIVARRPRAGGPEEHLRDVFIMVLILQPEGWRIARLAWQPEPAAEGPADAGGGGDGPDAPAGGDPDREQGVPGEGSGGG